MLSNVCVCNQSRENRESLGREFQQQDRSFTPRVITKRRRSFGEVPQISSVEECEWTSASTPSDKSSVYSPCSFNDDMWETLPRSGLSSDEERDTEDEVQSSISQQSVSSFCSFKNCSGSKADEIPLQRSSQKSKVDNNAAIACGSVVDSPLETPTLGRGRSNAVELKPVKRPGGKFLTDDRYYLQHATGEWECVTIKSWNQWNGTWQVKGNDEKTFPAAPIALKNKEEYVFLSRRRSVKPRSFGSFADQTVYSKSQIIVVS